jgi:hypothetical protein
MITRDPKNMEPLLDKALDVLMHNATWERMKTRSGASRKYEQWTFENGNCPSHLSEVSQLIEMLLSEAQRYAPGVMTPLQCFLCLYEQATDTCPAHSHACRQLTLSLGSERTMQVGRQRFVLRHGDVLVLNGERHAILPSDAPSKPRVSINVFFTVANEPHASVNTGIPIIHPTPRQHDLAPPRSAPNVPQLSDTPLLRREELLSAHSSGAAAHSSGAAASNDAPLSVCVIGGGAAGLGCCHQLCHAPGVLVTMVVEGRGIGGRMCTKVSPRERPLTRSLDLPN